MIIIGEAISWIVFAVLRRIKDPDSLLAGANGELFPKSDEHPSESVSGNLESEQNTERNRKTAEDSRRRWAVGKGMLERLTIVVGLLGGFPHILTVIGALKIGTRLQDDTDHISNTYFLTGNLVSILLALTYAIVLRWLW